jgi:hypothetical protein
MKSSIFEVGRVAEANTLVARYHYIGTEPAKTRHVGTWRIGKKYVAACYISPPKMGWPSSTMELSRLVRVPGLKIPFTGLISKTVKYVKANKVANLLIAYASQDFEHHGGIYQAASWYYTGERGGKGYGGLIIDGEKWPNRKLFRYYDTTSFDKLEAMGIKGIPYHDELKYLYWKLVNNKGKLIAKDAGLLKLEYPKFIESEIEVTSFGFDRYVRYVRKLVR